MTKKTRIVIAWILIVILLILPISSMVISVFAAELEIVAVEAEEKPMELTIEGAKEYALLNNKDVLLFNVTLDKALEGLEAAVDSKDGIDALYDLSRDNRAGLVSGSFAEYQLRNGYTTANAEYQKKAAEIGKDVQDKGIELSIEDKYYTAKLKSDIFELKKKSYNNIKTQVEQAKLRLELGQISELQYEQILITLDVADMEFLNAENDYLYSMYMLKDTLGMDIDKELVLTSNLIFEEYVMPEVSVIATSKTGNNPEIVYEEDVLDLYEMNHRFNKGYYGKKSSYAAFAEQDLKTKTIEIEKARKLIEIDSRKVVMDFNSLKKGLEISKKTVDLQTKMYEVMKLKYETGLATDSDVISSEIDLIGSKISCAETLHAYKLFIEKVKKGL